jgi:P22 coat protein - gene protein 5
VPNLFLTADWLSMEALRILKNKLEVAQFFNTEYGKDYEQDFAVGATVRIKLPQRFTVRTGLGYQPQAINRINTTVSVNQIFGVDFEWDSVEKALSMERSHEEIKAQYLDPIMAQLAQEIDSRCAQWAYQNTNNIVGKLGTDPTTLTTIGQARQRLIEKACPADGEKGLIIPPQVNTSLVPAFATFFNPTSEISKQYKEGSIGIAMGFDWYESASLYTHTAGTWASTVTVNGANQSGSTLAVTATIGDTFNVGDVFNIALVNAVNPSTRRVIGSSNLQQFVVTAPLTALGAGNAADVLQISPAIFGPGSQYQNVDALPVSGQALTLFPNTPGPNGLKGQQALAIHKDAFALVGVKLELPKAVEMSSQTRDPDSGISVRFVRAWDNIQSKMTNRFDVLLGFGNLYPDNCAVRIQCA